jgi:hypothetical protein
MRVYLFVYVHIQDDQKVSVHLMITIQKELHRDFLIALYTSFYLSIKEEHRRLSY